MGLGPAVEPRQVAIPQAVGLLPPSVPVAFPQQLASFVPEWAKVPFDVTLRRVEDQRTELDRMQKELDQRAAEVAQLREQLVVFKKAKDVETMAGVMHRRHLADIEMEVQWLREGS